MSRVMSPGGFRIKGKYAEPLIVPCPKCKGKLVRRFDWKEVRSTDGGYEDVRQYSIVCADCGTFYGEEM